MLKEQTDIKEVMQRCYGSTKVTAKVLFPERFELPFSKLHDEIFKVLDDDSINRVVIAAPRGFGKTSLCTIAQPAKRILFGEKKFIVPISATATNAVTQGENLKRELLYNPMIKELFGPMKSEAFSRDQWITSSGTMVMPRGAGQQVRGNLFNMYRPDLIIADDLENSESVMSAEQRAKLKDWWFSDVCNSINRAKENWKIIVVGTVLHEDSLLVNLLEDPAWHSVQLSICDDNYKSNWPDFMDDAAVMKLRDEHADRGQLDMFYREYRNIPVSTEDATFRPEYFQYYDEPDIADNKDIETVIMIDPAKTVKLHSAQSAIVAVGIDRASAKLYVRDIVAEKLYPDELYDEAFKMSARLGAGVVGIEVTSLNEFITQPIKNEMSKRGQYFQLIELKARGKKEDRIAALVPFYRQGYVFHNKQCCGGLEGQLLSFPRSRLWDIMDALAYVVEMMEIGERYFEPPEQDDPEDEFKELDYDKAVNDWRYV
jgi:hypothetical protein